MSDTKLTEDQRAVFAEIADLLIPEYKQMPAASAVGVHTDLIDDVVHHRPDLVDGIQRALERLAGGVDPEAVQDLYDNDRGAFDAVSLAASAGYYMSDTVWSQLGYPGQENAPFQIDPNPEYMREGLLDRVRQRGPIYRPTPK